jgi:hypothetical protein
MTIARFMTVAQGDFSLANSESAGWQARPISDYNTQVFRQCRIRKLICGEMVCLNNCMKPCARVTSVKLYN